MDVHSRWGVQGAWESKSHVYSLSPRPHRRGGERIGPQTWGELAPLSLRCSGGPQPSPPSRQQPTGKPQAGKSPLQAETAPVMRSGGFGSGVWEVVLLRGPSPEVSVGPAGRGHFLRCSCWLLCSLVPAPQPLPRPARVVLRVQVLTAHQGGSTPRVPTSTSQPSGGTSSCP